jgi:hypothetical protein
MSAIKILEKNYEFIKDALYPRLCAATILSCDHNYTVKYAEKIATKWWKEKMDKEDEEYMTFGKPIRW